MAPIGATIREMMKSRNLMVITLTQSLFMLTASLWWPYWSLYILELGVSKTLLGLIFMARDHRPADLPDTGRSTHRSPRQEEDDSARQHIQGYQPNDLCIDG